MSNLTTDVYDQANSTWNWEIGKTKLFKTTTFILLLTCVGPKGETQVTIYSDTKGKKYSPQPVVEFGRKHYSSQNAMSFQYYDPSINGWKTFNPNSTDKLYNKIYSDMVPLLKYDDGKTPVTKKEEGNFDKPLTEEDAPPVEKPIVNPFVPIQDNREPDVQSIYATKLAYEPSFFEIVKPYIVPFGAIAIGGAIVWKIYHPLNQELEKLHKRTRQLQDAQRKKDQLKLEQSESYRRKAELELELENSKNEIEDADGKLKKHEITEKEIKKRIKELVNNDLEAKIVKKELKNLEKDLELDQQTGNVNAIDLGAVKLGANLVNTLGNVGIQGIRSTEGAINNVVTNTSNLIGTGVKAGSDVIKGAVNTTGQLLNTGLKETGQGVRQLGANLNTSANKVFDATVTGIENVKDRKLEEQSLRARNPVYDQREREKEALAKEESARNKEQLYAGLGETEKQMNKDLKEGIEEVSSQFPKKEKKIYTQPKKDDETEEEYAKRLQYNKEYDTSTRKGLKKQIEATELDLTPLKDVTLQEPPAPVLTQEFSPIRQTVPPEPVKAQDPTKEQQTNLKPIEPQLIEESIPKKKKGSLELEDYPEEEDEPIEPKKSSIQQLKEEPKKSSSQGSRIQQLPALLRENFPGEKQKIADLMEKIEDKKYTYLDKTNDFILGDISNEDAKKEIKDKTNKYVLDKYKDDYKKVATDFSTIRKDKMKEQLGLKELKKQLPQLQNDLLAYEKSLEGATLEQFDNDEKSFEVWKKNNMKNYEKNKQKIESMMRTESMRDNRLKKINALEEALINNYSDKSEELKKLMKEEREKLNEQLLQLEIPKQ